MSNPYQILYKNGEWQVDEDQLRNILDESGSDSGDDVILDANVIHFDDIDGEEESDSPTDDTDTLVATVNTWYSDQFEQHELITTENLPSQSSTNKSPLEYFTAYFNANHFIDAARHTNVYHLKARGTELKTSPEEIKKLYGICLMMGCVSYPRIDMYWRKWFRFEAISNTMSRNRFRNLRNSLHFVDINETSTDPTNLFWKIQPIITAVRDRCRSLPKSVGHYSIDEQMIPYTGRCPARQYVKNKPRPVGLKNFVITTSTGLVVDFQIYQGDKTDLGDRTLGLGPAVVLHLVKHIPKGSFVYFDRYFTTVPLLHALLDLGIRATGTIMTNRLKNLNFKNDRHMERGESQEFVHNNGTHKICVVKWKDSKCVTALSSIAGANPTSIVNRWNKKTKSYQNVVCPLVISQYNKNMGGVDLVDQMMEYYRSFIKTKKWTLKAATHLIDLAVVNSWMEYRIDCKASGIPKKHIKDLLDFKMEIASALIATVNKRRYASSADEEDYEPCSKNLASPLPCIGKRYDGYEHWPNLDSLSTARFCRLETCKSRTRIRCEKCNIYLCLSAKKNCFKQFHLKNC